MYAQDYDENFPFYDCNGGTNVNEAGPGQSLSLLIPKYVILFVHLLLIQKHHGGLTWKEE